MQSEKNRPTHITRGDVLDDLGFSPEEAVALKFKADLYQAIMRYARKYSPKQLEAIFGEPQPRVSELLNGKIGNKSVDKLLAYAYAVEQAAGVRKSPASTPPLTHEP